MKLLACISLIVLFLAPAITKTGVWVWYENNKEDITMNFCVNKDKPDMACNGQCHMKKTMEKVDVTIDATENSEQQTPQRETAEDISPYVMPSQASLSHSNSIDHKTMAKYQASVYTNPYQELECPPPEMTA